MIRKQRSSQFLKSSVRFFVNHGVRDEKRLLVDRHIMATRIHSLVAFYFFELHHGAIVVKWIRGRQSLEVCMLDFSEKSTKLRQDCIRILLDFYMLITSIIFLLAVLFAVAYIGP